MTNHLHEIEAQGQSLWLDNISRQLLDEGILERLIKDDGVSGVTSNPSIFEKAMGHGDRYDDGIREAVSDGLDARDTFLRLALKDIREGADLLRETWERTNGADGYISFELLPELADQVEGSVSAAKHFVDEIDRENLLIKVPGTAAGVEAFRELTALGISVNVTLLFAVERYEEIADAYVTGLERRAAAGEPVDGVASVASFFVSRVDGKVDAALEKAGRSDLQGKAAIANARVAYESFQRIFSGPRWEALAAKGARVQRPLWASTSTKNPAYPDTLYIDELIGPDTVNTVPDATLDAARDHGVAKRTIDKDVAGAHKLLDQVRAAGVDIDRICGVELVEEGVASFAKAYDDLISSIEQKSASLATAGASKDG
ncbi:MAG TPA: transaldolase [Gaiellales bacterium]|jgi:transaldolase